MVLADRPGELVVLELRAQLVLVPAPLPAPWVALPAALGGYLELEGLLADLDLGGRLDVAVHLVLLLVVLQDGLLAEPRGRVRALQRLLLGGPRPRPDLKAAPRLDAVPAAGLDHGFVVRRRVAIAGRRRVPQVHHALPVDPLLSASFVQSAIVLESFADGKDDQLLCTRHNIRQ